MIENYSSPVYSSNGPRLKNRKSTFVTYLLWLIGGYFGLHHFYLKRDRHAFLTWATFGGYFGFGLIHDFFTIPSYVKDYNEDKDYIEKLIETIKKNKKPSYTWYRRFSSIAIANVFGYLFQAAIPNKEQIAEDFMFKFLYFFFTSFCISIGIYLVGNIGRIKGSFSSAFKIALVTLPVFFIYDRGVLFSSITSTFLFEYYSISWRKFKNLDQSLCKRLFILTIAALIYFSLWSSWIYFNCSYVTEEGEEVKCRKLMIDFLNSPSVAEIKQLIRDIKIYIQVYGLSSLLDELFSVLGTQSEEQALKVLSLPKNASSQDISQAYRQLSKKYHPDKQKNLDDKLNAEDKFIEVQKAYRVLLEKGLVSRKLN